MNKKIIVSMVAILTTIPSYSESPSHCNNTDLSTYTGPANLTAQWQGNTINVTWYDGEDTYESNSCTYGGTLYVPSAPNKTGYTFRGWRVRPVLTPQTFDLTTLDPTIGYNNYAFDMGGGSYYITNLCNITAQEITESGKYGQCFSYGTVIGTSLCSSSNGTLNTVGTPDESNSGDYCWCKATAFKPINGTKMNVTSSNYVYVGTGGMPPSEFDCSWDCEQACFESGSTDFRRALYGITQ